MRKRKKVTFQPLVGLRVRFTWQTRPANSGPQKARPRVTLSRRFRFETAALNSRPVMDHTHKPIATGEEHTQST